MTEPTFEDIVRRLDAIAPHVESVPLLQNSIEALHRDVSALRDELRAIHQWMFDMNNRMRKLEVGPYSPW